MDGQEVVSKREHPVVEANPFRAHGYGAEAEIGAVEEPEHQRGPDERGNQVPWLLLGKAKGKKSDHSAQGDEHDAVLNQERLDDEDLGCHDIGPRLPYSLLSCQSASKWANLPLDSLNPILLDSRNI